MIISRDLLKKTLSAVILLVTIILPLAGCYDVSLVDAPDPADTVLRLCEEFWQSDVMADALFQTLYPDITGAAKRFYWLNSLNASMKLSSLTASNAETIRRNGKSAKVRLTVNSLDFPSYYDAFCEDFEELKRMINAADTLDDETMAEVDFRLRTDPGVILGRETTRFSGRSIDFKLKYENDRWVIKRPAVTEGLFLELYAKGIGRVMRGRHVPG